MLRLLCLHEHGGPVGVRGEELGFRGDLGFRRERFGLFWGGFGFSWGRIRTSGKDSGFREEDFGLSCDGIRAFVGRDWQSWGGFRAFVGRDYCRAFVGRILSFREACGLSCGGSWAFVGRIRPFVGRIWAFVGIWFWLSWGEYLGFRRRLSRFRGETFGLSRGGLRVLAGGFWGRVSGFGGRILGLGKIWVSWGYELSWGGP